MGKETNLPTNIEVKEDVIYLKGNVFWGDWIVDEVAPESEETSIPSNAVHTATAYYKHTRG